MVWQPVPVVYVDVAFLVNLMTDLAWLLLTAVLAGVRVRFWQVALGAAGGAAAAVWSYFPTGAWLRSPWGVMGGTLALACLAYMPQPLRRTTRLLAYFLFSGGVMAGAVLLVGRFAPEGAGGGPVPGQMVAAGLLLCLVGGRYLWMVARERRQVEQGLWRIRVSMGGARVEIPALVDTGNTLRAPLTGTPVVVAEAAALAEVLPPEVIQAAASGWSGVQRLPPDWASRCRPVPFRAVGQETGVLPAFAVDGLEVRDPGGVWRPFVALVGLAGFALHPEGAYRALLPGQVARQAE